MRRRTRLFTMVLGTLLAVVLTPLCIAPGAAADPLLTRLDAEFRVSGVAAPPTCTSWASYFHWHYTNLVIHVPAATGQIDCVLRQGNRNDAVKVLQRALYYCNGYTNVAVDGEYGSITRGAVLDFQQDINRAYGTQILIPDGVYRMELLDWMTFPLWTHPANTRTGICATL
jgi:hypothetical protein